MAINPLVLPNINTATLKAFPAATSRPWSDRLLECVSVKDFGAKGDASTNDGPALQKAFDFLRKTSNPSSRALHFPRGKYLTSQVLYITNTEGADIFGSGPVETVIQYTGSPTAGNSEATSVGGANTFTPVIMVNGFAFSSFSGIQLTGVPGASTCGIYFYQDDTASKGICHDLMLSNVIVTGGCQTGHLIGYQANALCSEISFHNCMVEFCAGYGFRNISSNALNNNLYNCGGTHNGVWLSCPSGNVHVYGASLAVNTVDIQPGQNPMVLSGVRSESFQFLDCSVNGQSFVTMDGCNQSPPDTTTPGYFVHTGGSGSGVTMDTGFIESFGSTQGRILGDGYVWLKNMWVRNRANFMNSFAGSVRQFDILNMPQLVAELPPAHARYRGVRLAVLDSNIPMLGNFATDISGHGGGANAVGLMCDGAAWRIGG